MGTYSERRFRRLAGSLSLMANERQRDGPPDGRLSSVPLFKSFFGISLLSGNVAERVQHLEHSSVTFPEGWLWKGGVYEAGSICFGHRTAFDAGCWQSESVTANQ
jgi:hypothetical protein